MTKKNILVTGAAGFIGSFLCEDLIEKGNTVIGIDNFFRGNINNLQNIINHHNFQLINLDLSQNNNVDKIENIIIKNKINTVFHLAAVNGTQYFYDKPSFVLDQNITITQNLLKALLSKPPEFLIYSSSSEVYGDPKVIPTNEDEPITLQAMADRDSYASSKAIGDFYVRLFAQSTNCNYLILRIFNLYGERMVGTRYGQVIAEFIHRSLYEENFTIIGNGSNTRSFCYIKDAIDLIDKLFNKKATGIINLGNNYEISILELAKLIHKIENKSFNPIFLPERPFDHLRRCPDITKLKHILPDLKFLDLESGLKKVIDYYKTIPI